MSSVTISGNPSGSGTFTVQSPNSNTSRTITLPDATTTLVGTDATQTLTNKTIVLPSAAVGGVVDGEIEYDGKVGYFTPVQRGVIPAQQFFRLNADISGANATVAQNMFGVGVTLSASTVYAFEMCYALEKTAGVTSHTISLLFGGTATINNFLLQGSILANGVALANGRITTGDGLLYMDTTAATVISAAISTAAANSVGTLIGTVSIDAGGTFIPQYQLSAAPGGAYVTKRGSHFRIYPIGAAGADVSVGTWA